LRNGNAVTFKSTESECSGVSSATRTCIGVIENNAKVFDALGLNYWLKYKRVIIPQAMKIAVPPGIGFLIGLVKQSSLVSVIGFIELTRAGGVVSNLTADPITTYLMVALFYFVICFGISLFGRHYEKKLGFRTDSLSLQ
jgi:polar amino acid transport system permease protein